MLAASMGEIFFCFRQCLSHHLTDDLNFRKVCCLCWKKKKLNSMFEIHGNTSL